MQELICKNCGAELNPAFAENGVIKCGFCRSVFTVPKSQASPAVKNFLAMGEHDLDVCNFDNAYTAYKKAAELDAGEPEAYFGMALAEFKVQYIKDGINNCLQPVCHEVTDRAFAQNANYLRALSLATSAQRVQYERRGDDIDYIRKTFFELKNSGVKYDCFICVKVTDDTTKLRTADYKDADDIYFELKGKGYRPFFSERELRNVSGADYEARILYALYSSECMLVVCGKEEYLQTPWVKNEYTRFLKLIGDEEKESDSITLVFSGLPIEKLPGKRGKIQAINLNQLNAFERIISFVETHTPEARRIREREKLLRQQRESESERKLKELEERLSSMQTPVQHSAPAVNPSANMFLVLANQFLQSGDFVNAKAYFNTVLATDGGSGDAWWGLFLADNKVSDESKLTNVPDLTKNINLANARKFASGPLKIRIEDFADRYEKLDVRRKLVYALSAISKKFVREEADRKSREAEAERRRVLEEKWAKETAYKEEKQRKIDEYNAKAAREKWLADFKITDGRLVKYLGSAKDIVIPDCVTSISISAFGKQPYVNSLIIPGTVKKIDSYIGRFPALNSLIIQDGVEEIKSNAFDDLNVLRTLVIPESVKVLGKRAFANLKNNVMTIYCRAESKPADWHKKWCKVEPCFTNKEHNVIWGYKGY